MHPLEPKAKAFRALHVPGKPLVLFNIWDAGSAKAVAETGAPALATGSWSVAAAHGYGDGEQLPLNDVLVNLARITRSTDLPVTVDVEAGYGDRASELGETITRTIGAGAIGCNLEDSVPGTGKLRDLDVQAERIAWARQAAEVAGLSYFINARIDVFFQGPPETHDGAMFDEALERTRAYKAAGADGIFVPGVVDLALITRLAAASPLPVNVMVVEATPNLSALAEAGVARVSHGPGPYLQAMAALSEGARAAAAG